MQFGLWRSAAFVSSPICVNAYCRPALSAISDCCRRPSGCCAFHGHISKTKQDRLIWNTIRKLLPLILLPHSDTNINVASYLTLASEHNCCQPFRSSSHRRCCQRATLEICCSQPSAVELRYQSRAGGGPASFGNGIFLLWLLKAHTPAYIFFIVKFDYWKCATSPNRNWISWYLNCD